MGGGDCGGTLPRADASLLREAYDREGREWWPAYWLAASICSDFPVPERFLLAAMHEGDRFPIVNVRPNASVASICDRMPLVLGPDFPTLGRRGGISLISRPEP